MTLKKNIFSSMLSSNGLKRWKNPDQDDPEVKILKSSAYVYAAADTREQKKENYSGIRIRK